METITDEFLNEVISKVAITNNMKEWCYHRKTFETIAQNYFGIIIPVVVTGNSDRNEQKVTLKLVLKLAPTDERYRISGAVTSMFVREIYMYDIVLRKYQEIQQNFPERSKYIIPCTYYMCQDYCNEVIAMQDMCSDFYKPYTEEKFLDLDYLTISVKSLAKLHALSFLLRYQNLQLYEEISKVCIPLTEKTNKRYMDIMRDRLCKAIKKIEDTKYVPLLTYLNLNCSKLFEDSVNKVEATCICHGDIWKENILFKYESNTPISACLIDYQASRIASPVFDLLYLIISSTSTELRQKHYHNILDLYYQTFEQMLAIGGLDAQNVYSKELFLKDLKVVWPTCLIMANTALWLSSGLQEEGHVRSKHILHSQEEKDMAVIHYKTIVKAIIDDLLSYGYQLSEEL